MLICLQHLSWPSISYPAMPLARQQEHQRDVPPNPLVLGRGPLKSPTPTTDRDRPVSRRSKPSSRTAFIGEQPNPWELLHPQDAMSRHRTGVHAFTWRRLYHHLVAGLSTRVHSLAKGNDKSRRVAPGLAPEASPFGSVVTGSTIDGHLMATSHGIAAWLSDHRATDGFTVISRFVGRESLP